MAGNREAKIRAAKRAEFRDRQKQNRFVGQLNQEYAALRNTNPTMTAQQIFAAQGGATATVPGSTTTTPGATTINGPAGRDGIMGQGTPKTGPVGPPAWASAAMGNSRNAITAESERNGLRGTGTTTPAWWSSINPQTASSVLTGLGLASNAMPLLGGTLGPAFMSLARAVNPQGSGTTTQEQYLQPDLLALGSPKTGPVGGPKEWRNWTPLDFSMFQTGPHSNYGSWYNNYRKRRGGGGGRRYQQRGDQGYVSGGGDYNNGPAWGSGLANWSIG
jgi:hypothetical protein